MKQFFRLFLLLNFFLLCGHGLHAASHQDRIRYAVDNTREIAVSLRNLPAPQAPTLNSDHSVSKRERRRIRATETEEEDKLTHVKKRRAVNPGSGRQLAGTRYFTTTFCTPLPAVYNHHTPNRLNPFKRFFNTSSYSLYITFQVFRI